MSIIIEVEASRTETVTQDDLDSIRCPECNGLKFWLSEEGVGYCADCDCGFIADPERE